MRTVIVLAVAFVLGLGLAFVLLQEGGNDAPLLPPEPTDPDAAALEANPHLRISRGALTVGIRAPDGTIPEGGEVGYRFRGELTLLYTRDNGARRIDSAPIGELEIVGRAPGFREATQVRHLIAGVPLEVRLVLEPDRD